ncbi:MULTISPECIES: GspH/FimT family pseudopilin [Pseudomonas]|uniref:GspH/FimT family pseudopilin n=1 Tax=Pseudomonas TaxID=286 RepID=UPI000A1F4DC2|nr:MULTISPECIES: GspH/FimT family pseudopilin [Pseudomonas]MCX4217863.1 GspH/FimT family pseudopilin [Pseudomonas sp. MCal1]UIN55679.1 GspH/FimT family pseudopilin [Pseudomonas kribbensis]
MPQQGFSLVELLMGLAIGAIVLSLVGPALADFTESNRRQQAAQSLLDGIRNARTMAITRNQSVVIHGINGDWGQGWRIILDISGKGAEDTDNPLLIEQASDGKIPIVGNWLVSRYIRFSSLGQPLVPDRKFQAGTLHLCSAREPVSQLQVVLAATGRVRLTSQKAEQALCRKDKAIRSSERAAL